MTDVIPKYPMARKCPPAPPPGYRDLAPIQRIRIWDGSTPWVVTGWEKSRQIMADKGVSNDVRREGYPHTSEAFKALRTKGLVTFDRMDSPEHERQRRMLTKDFAVRNVQQMRPSIQNH